LHNDTPENAMLHLKNILVGTDFSESSDAALRYARELARRFGARLHVLHALEVPPMQLVGSEALAPLSPEVRVELEAEARANLDRLVTPDDRRLFKAITAIRDRQTPTEAIAHYAADADIDLIVLGTHGRRGLSHLFMGSVAEKVVRTAPCPVLTVRRHERDSVIADMKTVAAEPVTA
jgi:nucleotide-binding universal stress UspA family protein